MAVKLRIMKKDENFIPYNSFCKGITKCASKNVVCSKMCLQPSSQWSRLFRPLIVALTLQISPIQMQDLNALSLSMPFQGT